MNLIIDRGNTFVKWALFEGDAMRFKFKAKSVDQAALDALFDLYDIEHCILSATANFDFSEEILSSKTDLIKLDHLTRLPFVNLYSTPETLGRDRMAAVAAARVEWPNRDVLIIDTGTCITIDFINQLGQYLGGNISPGPELRFKAMHEGTAFLPLVERPDDFSLIGESTVSALQNGGFAGCVAEIKGWIELTREQFEDPIVVLSGGDATAFATSFKNEIFVRPDLVLTGLNEILKFNVEKI
jgi:type III pantothenate kinase